MYRGDDGEMYRDEDDEWFTKRWRGWSNEERLAWMVNFRDKLKAKYAKKFNISQERLDELERDVKVMEQIVAQERLAEKIAAEDQMNFTADQILRGMDERNKKSIYIPPKLPRKKDSN